MKLNIDLIKMKIILNEIKFANFNFTSMKKQMKPKKIFAKNQNVKFIHELSTSRYCCHPFL